MRIFRYLYNSNVELGIENNNVLSKLNEHNTIVDLLEDGYNNSKKIEELISSEYRQFSEVHILSPIEKPVHDIICVGKNYVDHISELGGDITKEFVPNYFGKRAVRIKGPEDDIEAIFNIDEEVDYEVELALIISKTGKNIKRDDVYNHILGFSIFNDVSSRFLQYHHNQWYKGKGVDNYSILGPCVVTVDEFELPLELKITSKVNDEIRQDSNTNKMIFNIEDIVTDISTTTTLEACDIIATGTPSGVGKGFNPPKYIKKGDIVELEIEKIGKIRNRFI